MRRSTDTTIVRHQQSLKAKVKRLGVSLMAVISFIVAGGAGFLALLMLATSILEAFTADGYIGCLIAVCGAAFAGTVIGRWAARSVTAACGWTPLDWSRFTRWMRNEPTRKAWRTHKVADEDLNSFSLSLQNSWTMTDD